MQHGMLLEEYVTKTVLQPKSNSFNALHLLVEQIQSGCAGEKELNDFKNGLRAREADIKQMRDEIIIIQRQIDAINDKNVQFRKNIQNKNLLNASTMLIEGANFMQQTKKPDICIENPDATQEKLLRELELLIIKQVGLRRLIAELKDTNYQIEKQTLDFQESINTYRQRYQALENLNNQQVIALGVPKQVNTQAFQENSQVQDQNALFSQVINLTDLQSIHTDNVQSKNIQNNTKQTNVEDQQFVQNLIQRLKASSGLDMVQKVCSAHIIYHGLENQLQTSIDCAVKAQKQRALLLTQPELLFSFLIDLTIDAQRQIAQIQYQQENNTRSNLIADIDEESSTSSDHLNNSAHIKQSKYKFPKTMNAQELAKMKTKCSVSSQVVKALIQALELEEHKILVKNSDVIAWMEYQRDNS